MKERIRFQCRIDLKLLRKMKHLSTQEAADAIYCSTRTLERIEKDNGTSNAETARLLCSLYNIKYDEQFLEMDAGMLDWMKAYYLEKYHADCSRIMKDYVYYCLYVRRIDMMRDCVFGQGLWIRDYGRNKEIRMLHKIDIEKFMEYEPDIPIINEPEEWECWYFGLTIGKLYKVIMSRKCMEAHMSDCLKKTIVKKDKLTYYDGTPDIMAWGKMTADAGQ